MVRFSGTRCYPLADKVEAVSLPDFVGAAGGPQAQ